MLCARLFLCVYHLTRGFLHRRGLRGVSVRACRVESCVCVRKLVDVDARVAPARAAQCSASRVWSAPARPPPRSLRRTLFVYL